MQPHRSCLVNRQPGVRDMWLFLTPIYWSRHVTTHVQWPLEWVEQYGTSRYIRFLAMDIIASHVLHIKVMQTG